MDELTCQGLLSHLRAYVDGEASAAVREGVERHVASCANCRVVMDTLRQTAKLYHGVPQPELPDEARERLFRALHLDQYLKPKAP
jgi:anti-sigma factor RsiW